MTTTNDIAGSGYHSHDVPTVDRLVVTMTDGGHQGTDLWWDEDADVYRVSPRDGGEQEQHERLVLVRGGPLTDHHALLHCEPALEQIVAVALDSPYGLAFLGLDLAADLADILDGTDSEVLWDSAAKEAE